MWGLYIYLPYSLAFLALGLAMSMAARSPVPVLPRPSLWLLAGFGLSHGAHEWIELAELLELRCAANAASALHTIDPAVTALSFVFLMQAGVETLIVLKRWPRWTRWVPAGLFLAWVAVAAGMTRQFGPTTLDWESRVDVLSRYFIGLSGALVTAWAFRVAAVSPLPVEVKRIRHFLTLSAAMLVAYGLFAGLLTPPAQYLAARWINTDTFNAAVHFPAEGLRAMFALLLAGFLSEACVVEAGWLQTSLERLREEFISVVAHDLRGPLTTITLNAAVIERLPSESHHSEHERRLLVAIAGNAKRLSRMIEDLLAASRIEARRMELRKSSVDVGELTRGVVERAAGMTEGHPVRVTAPEGVLRLEADPGRIEQVLGNLLSNAAKHSFPGAEIVVGFELKPDKVQFSVTNQGPGIGADELPKLFTRFYRGKPAREGRVEGLGLGLYIAKGLVEAHGGNIWVESTPGQTTRFCFTLPRP